VAALEIVALGRDIDPKTALPAYRAATLDLEAKDISSVFWGRRQIDVGARNIRGAGISQWQQVDCLRG